MQYKILNAPSSSLLEQEVNEYIKKGWKPQGGVCYIHTLYYQAMIKE